MAGPELNPQRMDLYNDHLNMAEPMMKPVPPVPLDEFLLEDYVATILPPVIFRAPHDKSDGFYNLTASKIVSDLTQVRTISKAEFVASVEDCERASIRSEICD